MSSGWAGQAGTAARRTSGATQKLEERTPQPGIYRSMASGPWETGPATDNNLQHHNMGPNNNTTSQNQLFQSVHVNITTRNKNYQIVKILIGSKNVRKRGGIDL